MGGCGKTRLALEIAAEIEQAGSYEVQLIELADMARENPSEPDLLPRRVLNALDLETQGDCVEAIIAHLQGKPMLLLLDNCEHLIHACAELVESLLQSCPQLTVLATSRESLNIDGEHSFSVMPLSIPDVKYLKTLRHSNKDTDAVAALLLSDSARLFLDRIYPYRGFALDINTVSAIAAICATLDGIPLALELAAARVKMLTPEQIADMLADRFHLLTDGRRTALPRHKTLRALFDWSYDLLNEREQALLCHLSVFRGGWTLDAAKVVGSSGTLSSPEVLDLMKSLADKSLILTDLTGVSMLTGVSIRYGMLQTMQQYAEDQLRERGEWGKTRLCHRKFFLMLAEEAEQELKGPNQKHWLDQLDMEADNLRAALSSCEHATGQNEEMSEQVKRVETYLHLSGVLLPLWQMRGHLSEGRDWLEKALRQCRKLDLNGRITALAGPKAEALWAAGILAEFQSDYNSAQALTEESLAIRRQIGKPGDIAASLKSLGNVLLRTGDSKAATVLFDECLSLSREAGDQQAIAAVLSNMGIALRDQGNLSEAATYFEESLQIRKRLRNLNDIASTLNNLGMLTAMQGNYSEGIPLLEESLVIFRQSQDQHGIANTLRALGSLALMQRNTSLAKSLLEESLPILRQLKDLRQFSVAHCSLGGVALQQGDYPLARKHFGEGLRTFRAIGSPMGIAYGLEGYSAVTHAENELGVTAKLIGAAQAYRLTLELPLTPIEQDEANAQIAEVQAAMGMEAFELAMTEGRAMTWEQAVAFALGEVSAFNSE